MAPPRFAILFKAHAWDSFIARQFDRYRQAAGRGEVFLYLDETSGAVGAVPVADDHVIRATNHDLYAIGLGRRFERGSLLWWNTDYPHYLFAARHPGFDYVLCVEYDTCFVGDIEAFIDEAAARGADLVALPTRTPKSQWMWTRFHARTYPVEDITGSLNCISLYSARALAWLGQRRRYMADEQANGEVAFWPGNEVFVATETLRAGYRFVPLQEFGDVSRYEWHPPILDEDVPHGTAEMAFLHPVLDRQRFIASVLKFGGNPMAYFQRGSFVRRELARFEDAEYKPLLARAAWARLRMRVRERAEAVLARLAAVMRGTAGRGTAGRGTAGRGAAGRGA
jgi:hypothetical protein